MSLVAIVGKEIECRFQPVAISQTVAPLAVIVRVSRSKSRRSHLVESIQYLVWANKMIVVAQKETSRMCT